MVELLAGGTAAGLLVLLVLLFRFELWLGMSPAALAYAGSRLALRRAWTAADAE